MERNEILKKYTTIAVVGCSQNPAKPAYYIPRYLQVQGYRIIPVNPGADEILGETAYRSLSALPNELKATIDIVNIFRPSEAVLPIVEQAIELKTEFGRPYIIWMQAGIKSDSGAEKARAAGLEVIMDCCIMVEHQLCHTNAGA